jgi:site-specific DNA-cytosine methylase
MAEAAAEHCLFGVDIDAGAVARARRELPGAEIVHGDALAMDFGARRFDVVLGNPPWASFSVCSRRPVAEEHEEGVRMPAARCSRLPLLLLLPATEGIGQRGPVFAAMVGP